jgi:hypothetical protein
VGTGTVGGIEIKNTERNEKFRSDRIGSDRIGSDRIGSDRIGSDRIGRVHHTVHTVDTQDFAGIFI